MTYCWQPPARWKGVEVRSLSELRTMCDAQQPIGSAVVEFTPTPPCEQTPTLLATSLGLLATSTWLFQPGRLPIRFSFCFLSHLATRVSADRRNAVAQAPSRDDRVPVRVLFIDVCFFVFPCGPSGRSCVQKVDCLGLQHASRERRLPQAVCFLATTVFDRDSSLVESRGNTDDCDMRCRALGKFALLRNCAACCTR